MSTGISTLRQAERPASCDISKSAKNKTITRDALGPYSKRALEDDNYYRGLKTTEDKMGQEFDSLMAKGDDLTDDDFQTLTNIAAIKQGATETIEMVDAINALKNNRTTLEAIKNKR